MADKKSRILKTVKKITAFMLALITLLALPEDINANRQSPVIVFNIVDWTPRTSANYDFELKWTRPIPSQQYDTSAITEDQGVLHLPNGYDIFRRNASLSESYPSAAHDNVQFSTDPTTDPAISPELSSRRYNNLPLTGGSLYAYKVTAYHYHRYNVVDSQTGAVRQESRRAPAESGTVGEAESVYLSDIGVSATGLGSRLTIVWDNPKFDGAQVFTGYRLYYVQGGAAVSYFDENTPGAKYFDLYMDNPDLNIRADGKLEYTILDPTLRIAQFYAVKVEPLVGNSMFRKLSNLTIGAKNYNVAYPSMDREYRYNEAYISPPLYLEQQGSESLKLYWDPLTSLGTIRSIEIQSSSNTDFLPAITLGTLLDATAREVTHWIVTPIPSTETFYRLIIEYEVDGVRVKKESEIVSYNPGYDPFTPYKPEILEFNNTIDPISLYAHWEVFARDPYNDAEKAAINPSINKFVDKDIYYDIWLSDSLSMLNNANYDSFTIVPAIDAQTLAEQPWPSAFDVQKLYYQFAFNEYYTLNPDGSAVKKSIEQNKVYYIKIRARRKTGQISQTAYSSHYLQAIGDPSPIPQMSAKPPLRIRRDDDGNLVIGPDYIGIQWDRKWFEAYNPEDKTWYSQIGWDAGGKILFGTQSEGNNQVNLYDRRFTDIISDSSTSPTDTLKQALKSITGAPTDAIDQTAFRFIDLKNAGYEIHVAEYDEMVKVGTYMDYLNMLTQTGNENMWRQITPDADSELLHPHYTITSADRPSGTLKNNTAYVIFFRPYVVIDNKKTAWNPTFISATTMDVRPPVIIKPTVPILIPYEQTDMALTVKWEYSVSLQYELAYGDALSQYPDGGTLISYEEILQNGRRTSEEGVPYYYYTINDLFPDTQYYIWIRAIADNDGVLAYSQWSNPILMKTLELPIPLPPRGLGPASGDSIDEYNKENKLALSQVDTSYFIIEWMKDYYDRSENAASDGFPTVLLSQSLVSTYMAMVGDTNEDASPIRPNTEYYVRAKTVLTVSRTTNGHATRSYNYLIEVALDSNFENIVGRGYVPALGTADPDPYNDKRIESPWSETIMIKTSKSKGEYDSDADEKTHPLPVQDYEIGYDAGTGTLSLRFRTSLVDSAGNHDNMVDQRFISNLIAQQIGIYSLDLSNYENQPITTRIIEIPYSIMKTLDDRRIPFEVKAGGLTAVFMPGGLNIPQVFELKDFEAAVVKVTLTQNPGSTPSLNAGESYMGNTQRISLQVVSPSRTITPASLSSPMQISLRLDNASALSERNVAVYWSDSNSGGWQRLDANYVPGTGVYSFKTQQLATFGTISRPLPVDTETARQSEASYNIMTRLDIRDMPTYRGGDYITSNQLNNLVAAIARGSKSVSINSEISRDDYDSLNRAGYLISSGVTVQRQAGIYTLVRLYELKTQTAIKNHSNQDSSPYADISLADQKYKEALYKAGDLGFFGNRETSDPRALLTMADVLYMIDIIIGDSGM